MMRHIKRVYKTPLPSRLAPCHRSCCGTRCSPWRERLRRSPTAATRSGRLIRHRRRSLRSPQRGRFGERIATPACALARNDALFAYYWVGAHLIRHGLRRDTFSLRRRLGVTDRVTITLFMLCYIIIYILFPSVTDVKVHIAVKLIIDCFRQDTAFPH